MKEPGVVGDFLTARDPSDYEKNLATFVQKGYPRIFTIWSPHAAMTAKTSHLNSAEIVFSSGRERLLIGHASTHDSFSE